MELDNIDPNGGSLLAIINIYADFEAQKKAHDFLQRMGLPDAEEGEYFMAPKNPNVVRLYLPQGMSASFVFRNVNILAAAWSRVVPSRAVESARIYAACKLRDPEILQPLYQEELGSNCTVEIVPGIPRAKVDREGLKNISESLASRNIDFYLQQDEFIGAIKTEDGKEARLVTNRRAVRPMRGYISDGNGDTGLQDKVFGALRHEFQIAHNSGSAKAIQDVLKECAAIAACPDNDPNKVLYPYWKNSGSRSERNLMIVTSAQKYERRLAAL